MPSLRDMRGKAKEAGLMKLDKLIATRQRIPDCTIPIPIKELCERYEKRYTGCINDVMRELTLLNQNLPSDIMPLRDEMTVCGFKAEDLWIQVHQCWEGIYSNMTAKYCRSYEDWPVLYGIVLQNILIQAVQAGAPEEEACRTALVCAIAISKMDSDSF